MKHVQFYRFIGTENNIILILMMTEDFTYPEKE